MDLGGKTKDELISELKKLKLEYDILKTSYERDITRSTQAGDLLKESQKRLNEAQKLAHIGIWDWNPDTDTVTWTDELYSIAGLDPGLPAPTYKEHSSIYTPKSWELLKGGVEKALETGKPYQFELELIRPDGDIRYVNAFGGAKCDSKGQFIGLFGTVQDITDHRQTLTSLAISEARFRGVFENSLLGISIADPAGRLIDVNMAYAKMYGYNNPPEMLACVSNVKQLYANPENRDVVLHILSRNSFMEPKEFELVKRDGSRFFALVSASEVRDDNGKLLYNQATHMDLTERKKVEKKIRDSSLYARNLIEASLDPLVTISAGGKITDVNIATEKITGVKRDKLIGTDFVNYFTEPEKARKGYKIVFSKGIVKDYPLTIVHSNGFKKDVLYNATVLKDEEGEVQGVFAAARDITERKKFEEELSKSKKLLENLNKHLNDVRENERATISREIHDQLGQSMTALKLDLNQMIKYLTGNNEALMKLESIISLVSDTIKDVQRISSDLRPGILDDLGLVSAIEWYCDEFEKRTGIKCTLRYNNSDFSDPQINLTFFRVLQETLTNVIRHAMASSVSVRLHKSRKGTTLTILDNGIGVLKEQIESHKSLGFISMRERVRQFNGKIDISSIKSGGTKLAIYIP